MKKLSIILADEDQAVLNDLVKNFTEENFEIITTTSSGEDLITLVNKNNPDFVVMDIVLKQCDGFKVLENIKNTSTETNIGKDVVEVSTSTYVVPMKNATVAKDYSGSELQYNYVPETVEITAMIWGISCFLRLTTPGMKREPLLLS